VLCEVWVFHGRLNGNPRRGDHPRAQVLTGVTDSCLGERSTVPLCQCATVRVCPIRPPVEVAPGVEGPRGQGRGRRRRPSADRGWGWDVFFRKRLSTDSGIWKSGVRGWRDPRRCLCSRCSWVGSSSEDTDFHRSTRIPLRLCLWASVFLCVPVGWG
jgi:hypothetical protein